MFDPKGETEVLVELELFGRDEAFNAEFGAARLEVLANGDDIAACGVEIGDRLADLFFGLAESNHDARFHKTGFARFFCMGEDGKGSVVGRFMADAGSEGANSFDVVIEDFGFFVENGVETGEISR